ncbi:hypothetical protein ABK040_014655 [Willaertia magna]
MNNNNTSTKKQQQTKEEKIMTFTKYVRTTLLQIADKSIATQQMKYMKQVIHFHGLKAPKLNDCFKNKIKINLLKEFPNKDNSDLKDQMDVAFELLKSKYSEEKQVGIKILNFNVKKIIPKRRASTKKKKLNAKEENEENNNFTAENLINEIEEEIFKQEHVYDWATCDTLSSTVICELIKRDENLAKLLKSWKDSSNLWQQRSSCVSFVKIARHGEFNDLIFDICKSTV